MTSPFSNSQLSGVTLSIVGIMLVVLTGVYVSVLADSDHGFMVKKDQDSTLANSNLRRSIIVLEAKLAAMVRNQEIAAKHRKQLQTLKDLENQVVSAGAEVETVRRMTTASQSTTKLITRALKTYPIQYRQHIRNEIVGKAYEKFTTRLGKEYLDVRVLDATALGVSISHRNGTSLLGIREMPSSLQKQLMYTAAEVAEARASENHRQRTAIAIIERAERNNSKNLKVQTKNREILRVRRLLARLQMNHDRAVIEENLARQSSTPRDFT